MKRQVNLIIAGIGGQGINGFTRAVHALCEEKGWYCISAVYKGGAQRLGSVRAEMKLFSPECTNVQFKSSQIIPGTLDILIALEQWESLRYLPYCNDKTHFVLDEFIEFPPGTKDIQHDITSPIDQLKKRKVNTHVEAFRKQSLLVDGHSKNTLRKMWNCAFSNLNINELYI